MRQLLGGLQRLGRIPPEAILSHAKSVTELSRAATIMGNAVPAVQQALEPLRDEIETVKELRGLIDNRRIELVTLSNTLEQQDKELEALLNDRAERLAHEAAAVGRINERWRFRVEGGERARAKRSPANAAHGRPAATVWWWVT